VLARMRRCAGLALRAFSLSKRSPLRLFDCRGCTRPIPLLPNRDGGIAGAGGVWRLDDRDHLPPSTRQDLHHPQHDLEHRLSVEARIALSRIRE